MRSLDEYQTDFKPEEMAFRFSAVKSDLQPKQEITAYWDGRVVYLEEPALLSDNHLLTESGQWNDNGYIREEFYLEEDEAAEYLEELVNDAVDQLDREYINESEYSFKGCECWIEMTTGRGKQGIGWYNAPNIEPVVPSNPIPGVSGNGGDILPPSIEQVWEELTEKAYSSLK